MADDEDDEDERDDDRDHVHFQDGRTPPDRVPKSERILNLIAVLLRAEKPVPVAEILGKVTGYNDGASRDSLMRRFERDKKVLRDIGIPIEHAPGGAFGQDGYSISRKDYFLDATLHLPPESGQILRLLYAWAHTDGGSLSADLRSALVKLGFLIDEDDAAPPLPATEALEPTGAAARRVEARLPLVGQNLELLSEAVLRHRRVRFRYFTFGRGQESEVTVDPYGLGFSSQAWDAGAWYLVGWSHARGAIRVFKLQRIQGVVQFAGADEDAPEYEIPPGFRVRRHLGKARWEWAEEGAPEPVTARVRFEGPVATEVRALVPSARSVERDDEHEVLEFEVRSSRRFLRFLLRFAPNIEVLSPAPLADELRALAREVLARYQETS